LLQGVSQAFDDAPIRFLGCCPFQDFLAAGKVAANEFELGQGKIRENEA